MLRGIIGKVKSAVLSKKVLGSAVFLVIVGGSLAMSRKTDAEVLTKVGRTATEQVTAVLPDRSAVAGPFAQAHLGDLTTVDQRVRFRLKTDAALTNANLTVSATQGTVKLTGRVDSTGQRQRAVELAQTTAGVTKVEQEIAVPEGK
jgi:osmotically-inducible protein OsmY